MTTILRALEELERRGTAVTQPAAARTERRRRPRGPIAAVLLTLIGGAIGLVSFIAGRHSPGLISTGTPTAVSPPQVLPQAQVVPPHPVEMPPGESSAKDALPWAYVERRKLAAQPAPAPVVPHMPRVVAQQPQPRRKVEAPQTAPAAPSSVPGQPRIQVQSIVYSGEPEKRAVTLRIDGRAATLREGESANGLEVQLILRDAVYLRHGGNVFAVSPAP